MPTDPEKDFERECFELAAEKIRARRAAMPTDPPEMSDAEKRRWGDNLSSEQWREIAAGNLEAAVAERDQRLTLAARIAELEAENARLREGRLDMLARLYWQVPREVADLCDHYLDKSGALLGEVRERARQSLGEPKP